MITYYNHICYDSIVKRILIDLCINFEIWKQMKIYQDDIKVWESTFGIDLYK